ncbi:MAG: methyltransferase domain-containing protein [Candidatus Omnitrophica bacterium]|nr:methyltransferase domain-containing protein [Candidatus Omnitrophota bacterium]
MELTRTSIVHVPAVFTWTDEEIWFFVNPDGPHWISTDSRGAKLLAWLAEPLPFGELVARYASAYSLELSKAWLHVSTFLHELLRVGFAHTAPIVREPYLGRSAYLAPDRLSEAWLHTNNSCNLTCTHCLVSSSPEGSRGLPTEQVVRLIDELAQMGATRFYFTGGEPFARRDIFGLIQHVTQRRQAELIILTNATLFRGEWLKRLGECDRSLLRLQVSVDGASPATNDPIRGVGSFQAATEGLRRLREIGFDTSLTTAVTAGNCEELPALTELAKALGAKAQHLMWLHKRGRIIESQDGWFPSLERLVAAVREVKRRADALGVVVDNYESFRLRVNGPAHRKYDLGNQGWSSLCVYADGHVYPSAAFANHGPLDCGYALDGLSLNELWLNSPVFQRIRRASLIGNRAIASDPFRFFTGGGDIEHSYYYSGGEFLGEDPYYPLYVAIVKDLMRELAARGRVAANGRSGYDAPRLFHAMGEGAIACGQEGPAHQGPVEVATLHSNCVLAFDVEKPRALVRGFYTKAAEQPQAQLCCPVRYDDAQVAHIPKEVLERFYGCGSPIGAGEPCAGEVVVDLGCGAGIDCFVAAKHIGPTGKAYGIDMTDAMLDVAARAKLEVAKNLGYDAVEFRRGLLERVPLEDKTADLVISNCVINLSPDKRAVFSQMWRLLKDHGRMCVADIVSEHPVPARLKINPQLWGECTVGALTEEEFLAYAEQAGFYGVQILKKSFYRTIEGHHFFSVTVRGYKFEKRAGCTYVGQTAIYHGPFKAVTDEEGHLFPRDVAIEVCTDTAAKLSQPPYRGWFTVVEPSTSASEIALTSDGSSRACGPGCC